MRQKDFAKSPMRYYSAYPPPIYNAMARFQGTDYALAARVYLVLLALLTVTGCCLVAAALPELGSWQRPFAAAMALSPFAFMAMLSGQLAGLWLAIFGAGILLVRRGRPLVGGLVLGFLCAKPSIGVPVAGMLLLTGNFGAFGAFVGGGAGLLGLSLAADGAAPWIAFVDWVRGGGIGGFRPSSSRQMTLRILLVYPFRKTAAAGPLETAALLVGLVAAVTAARRIFRVPPDDARWPLGAGAVLSGLLVALPYYMGYDQGIHALSAAGMLLALRAGDVGRPRLAWFLLLAWVVAPFLHPLSQAAHFSFGGLAVVAWYAWVRIRVERTGPG